MYPETYLSGAISGNHLSEQITLVVGFQRIGHFKLSMPFMPMAATLKKMMPPTLGHFVGIRQGRIAEHDR